jgi:hypothetical protein
MDHQTNHRETAHVNKVGNIGSIFSPGASEVETVRNQSPDSDERKRNNNIRSQQTVGIHARQDFKSLNFGHAAIPMSIENHGLLRVMPRETRAPFRA